ncbi:MAG TPA: hypothetical protein VNX18_13550 [Bryobacteraceae bacterium]|nr:hypothetical protein [Bryobacteraceae bacterium]
MRTLLLLSAFLTPVFAQSSAPAFEGVMATVRISEIKAGGSMDGFMKAMAAHKAWYRSHGVMDNEIFGAPIVIRDEKTHARSYSDKEIMTYHVNPPSGDRDPKQDDAYAAFVKLYRDNSDIKVAYNVCLPKGSFTSVTH